MGRWEADAEGRLRAAAIALFGEVGYQQTTVAAIAERAGVTSRTFFRYFADKREVLFNGSERLQQALVDGLAEAPATAPPLDAIRAALAKAGEFFDEERRAFARLRSTVIAAHSDLQERELIKLMTLSAALAQGLRVRGMDAADASLLAEAGMAVFKIAFIQWASERETRGYVEIVDETLARLKAITAS